ncbi:restriction endonuclease subunit S [Enterococcus faecium]|jgi:type I restriction enzyme S subunit|nr:restriction endonuclease subunit S [Enterococcus faecium]MDQ8470601.1 restriction endonuclease subunit S [Enterococcus faecium]
MLETKHTQLKNSGIAWIGSIPNDWMLKKIDYMSTSYSGGTPDRDNYSYWENGTVNWMSSGEVNKRLVYDTYEKISLKGLRNSSAKLYPENTVVFALNGQGKTKGMTAILKTISSGNQSLVGFICDEKELHYRFLDYCFQAAYKFNRSYYGGGDNRDGIAASNIKKMKIPTPSYNEQICLCDFLDSEIKKLDNIIASAKKSLELLRETRKSIIFEVVTKGLDNNVEMKDSGVEWIGWIPDSWKISKFKYEVSTPITDGPHETPELCEEGIPFASAEAVKNGIVDLRYIRGYISEKDHKQFSKKIRPQLNDIFIVKSGAGTGRSGIVTTNEVFDIWSPLALIRTKSNNHNQRYFYYFTLSDAYTKQVESGWSYGTQQNIGMNVLENLYVPVPSKDIQNEIVKYLDYKIGKIDTSIRKTQEIIDLTERTKQSLIYEYVTGKKRVQT